MAVAEQERATALAIQTNVERAAKRAAETVAASAGAEAEGAVSGAAADGEGGGAEELFCVCRVPWSPDDEMVGCDGPCGGWYHPACVGLQELPEGVMWTCPECSGAGATYMKM